MGQRRKAEKEIALTKHWSGVLTLYGVGTTVITRGTGIHSASSFFFVQSVLRNQLACEYIRVQFSVYTVGNFSTSLLSDYASCLKCYQWLV